MSTDNIKTHAELTGHFFDSEETDRIAKDTSFTRDRINEIFRFGNNYANWHKAMNSEEMSEVNRVWDTMPGASSFYTALCRIAKVKGCWK